MQKILKLFVCGFLASVLLSAPALAKKEPLRLKPSSKWNVNYAADSCRLARQFGEGDQSVILLIDRFEPGDSFRLSLAGEPVDTGRTSGDAEIRFGPAELEQKVGFYPGNLEHGKPALIMRTSMRIAKWTDEEIARSDRVSATGEGTYPSIGPDREAAVTSLTIGWPLSRALVLETGSMGNVFAAMRKCTDELLDHWGVDVAKHAHLLRPVVPVGNPAQWMKSSDYPMEMLSKGQRAIVQFRLNVDETGVATACHIQLSTRPKAFDDAVCKGILRRAHFRPALDVDGKPISSYWLNSVNFHI